jgi:dihydroxy-acid dehydratase
MYEVGGMPVLLKTLMDGGYLHGDCLTVTGQTLAETLADVSFPTDQDVIRTTSDPLSPVGGVVGLSGSLAPQGAIVKVAGLHALETRLLFSVRLRSHSLIFLLKPLEPST